MKRLIQLFDVDWGSSNYDTELRRTELLVRLRWFVALRWIAVVCCLSLAVAAYSRLVPMRFDNRLLAGASLFLALTNLLFGYFNKTIKPDFDHTRQVRYLVIAETSTDYLVLSVVSYATGGFEFPILAFFISEIILVSLFCRPAVSLTLTLTAVVFAASPMVLEHLGILPTLSIFETSYKYQAITDLYYTVGYIGCITLSFLFCWYLVAEISLSLRQREHEVEQTQQKLILLDKEKTQATLRATHELKAPLAAINSYIYTLRDGYCGELPEKAIQVLERIRTRADLLMNKIADIIHLSNLRTLVGEEASIAPIDLSRFVVKEIKEANLIGQTRGIQVHNLSQDCPSYFILGASVQLHSMISNLLRNAINYSHDGGTIEVSLSGTADQVSLTIEDQGIGIPEGNLERIFDEHFRSNNAVKHNPNGTGLGLSIVKEIARLHHALIQVSSKVGVGTKFTLTFTLLQPKKD